MKFSSGRLGHVWPFVNGVALANKDKTVFMLGSDGSQQVRALSFSRPFRVLARPRTVFSRASTAVRLL